jgi:hypothetical protein
MSCADGSPAFFKNASFLQKKMRTCMIIVQNKEIFFALSLLVRIFAAEKSWDMELAKE